MKGGRAMKRVVVLSCVALALSATLVASAWASPPEIGRCVVSPGKTGLYTTDSCTKLAKANKKTGKIEGAYEWEAGVANEGKAGAKNRFTGESSTATLENTGKVKVQCSHEVSSGEFTSPKTVGNISVTFTGCKEGLENVCTSPGAKEEEIKTKTLAGELVWEKWGSKLKKVAIRLFPQSGSVFAEFKCGPASSEVRENSALGGILASLPVGKMETKVDEKFVAKSGKQKPDAYYNSKGEKVACFLEADIGKTPFEQAGQSETNVQSDEEALEVNYVA
jgi:hypothetical protein